MENYRFKPSPQLFVSLFRETVRIKRDPRETFSGEKVRITAMQVGINRANRYEITRERERKRRRTERGKNKRERRKKVNVRGQGRQSRTVEIEKSDGKKTRIEL